MKRSRKAKFLVVATIIFAVAIGSVATLLNIGPFSSKASSLSSKFSTNASSVGKNASITIDGSFSDWDSSMLIAQGVANDDCRAFRGPHEGPVYDTYALYAAWDNNNLYLMWEIVNLTDVTAPEQDYPQSDNGKPWNGDIPQIITLDVDPDQSGAGTITDSGEGIWGMNINYQDGTDKILCFSSKPGVGTPALFSMNSQGGFSYEDDYCQGFKDLGITYKYGDGHLSDKLIGINMNGYTGLTTSMMFDDSASWTDLNSLGHDSAQDTMYEIAIPLSSLGIDSSYIENTGIGVRHISTFGQSAIQSLPVDETIYDNASEPYSADDSTSAEKEDDDIFSSLMARIGKSNGNISTPKPSDETPTAPVSTAPSSTSPASTAPVSTAPVVTDDYYGKSDNNNHSGETAYTVNDKPSSGNSTIKYAADKISDGVILQAFCWSFNTIKQNMADIKAAGYTTIQTSPISECRVGDGGDKSLSKWYYHYQPVSYSIGNYQLGTEDEFKAMCATAKSYGIRVIVDAVPNHMSSSWGDIKPAYQNRSYYHTNESGNYSNRYEVTQKACLGLWDVNTQSTEAQQNVLNYLKRCISDGASGFRYDTAKHIELPDDSGFGGNFWPTVLNNGSEFQYGEVLQDSISREDAYAKYMGVTASYYGGTIRDAVANNNFSTGKIMGYNISAESSKLVTWVESHDNFINDNCETVWMTNEQIKLAWACLVARKNTTPLFYSRPVGAGGTSYDSRFPGKSQIGDAGDSFYKDDEVAAVNLFRNAMEGESEYLRNIENEKILSIERGTKGQVIINLNYSSKTISSATNLANGEYTNMTDDNSTFKVSNGTITGTLPSRSVVVLYDAKEVTEPKVGINGYTENINNSFKTDDGLTLTLTTSDSTNATYSIDDGTSYKYTNGKQIKIGWGVSVGTVIKVTLKAENDEASTSKVFYFVKKDPNAGLTIYFEKPSNWSNTIYTYIYKENGSSVDQLAAWPGTAMKVSNGTYVLELDDDTYNGANVIFSDGSNQVPGAQETGYVVADGTTYDENGAKPLPTNTPIPVSTAPTSTTPSTNNTIQFVKPSGWGNTVYAYVYSEGTSVSELTSWPGKAMTSIGNSVYELTYTGSYSYVIFNDNSNQVPSAQQTGFGIQSNSKYDQNGYVGPITGTTTTTPPTTSSSSNKMTIYYYSGWSSSYIHYCLGGGDWTTAPGVAMSSSGISGYYKAEIDMGSSTTLKACFNNGSGTWDNNGGSDYSFSSVGTYTVKNGSITSGAPETSSSSNSVTIYYKTSWSNPYCHYCVNEWTSAPGVKMSSSSYSGYSTITISLGTASSLKACFNNGNGNWDNNNGNDYSFSSAGVYTVSSGSITSGTPN